MNYQLMLKAQNELSHWELSHILNVLGNTYMKLTMINEMQTLYDNGAVDNDFVIGSTSLELHINMETLNIPIPITRKNEYTMLDRKSTNANSFWEIFHKLHRPIIFYKTNDGYKSLYNYNNALLFKKIETNSPPSFTINGKAISIEIAKMVASSIIGYHTLDLIHGNENKQLLQNILTEQREIRELVIDNTNSIIQNTNTNAEGNQIEIFKKDDYKLLKQLNNVQEIDYSDFLKIEDGIIKDRFKKQIEKTPFIIEDFSIV